MLSERTARLMLMALVGLALLAMVAIQRPYFMRSGNWALCFAVGSLFGTFFGLVALAAAYFIFNRGPFYTRLVQSLVLCVLAGLAVPVSLLLGNALRPRPFGPVDLFELASTALFGLGNWLLIASLVWVVIRARSLRLSHISEMAPGLSGADQQFGVRDVLLLTAIIGGLLAAIRWLPVAKTALGEGPFGAGLVFFAYLALCHAFIMLPLLVTPLLRRHALITTLVALAFVALVTICENSAIEQIEKASSQMQLLIWHRVAWVTNCVQALWVLLAHGIVRAGGFRLAPVAKTQSLATAGVRGRESIAAMFFHMDSRGRN